MKRSSGEFIRAIVVARVVISTYSELLLRPMLDFKKQVLLECTDGIDMVVYLYHF
jgi:hypothetical protein